MNTPTAAPAAPAGHRRMTAQAVTVLLASLATATVRRCGFCSASFQGEGRLCPACALDLRACLARVRTAWSPRINLGTGLDTVRQAFAEARARAEARQAFEAARAKARGAHA